MMNYPKISLTGDLGSGKSHVSRLLAEKLGWEVVSTGSIQREIAAKYGMSTLELNEYTRTHPEIDDEIDGRIAALEHEPRSLIFDSRLAWHFAPSSFKVYLAVDSKVAAARIFNDNRASEAYASEEEALKKIMERRKSEVERFRDYYSIDYSDHGNYDLVVDTGHKSPEEVCQLILDAFRKKMSAPPHKNP